MSLTAERNRMGTLSCVTDFGQRKILCLKGLCYDFSSFFFLSLYRRTLQGNVSVLCFVNFPVANKFMDKTGGGSIKNFRRKSFCLTVPKNSYRNLLVCVYFRVSKSFLLQRVMSRFSLENFLSHSAENIRRGTF